MVARIDASLEQLFLCYVIPNRIPIIVKRMEFANLMHITLTLKVAHRES